MIWHNWELQVRSLIWPVGDVVTIVCLYVNWHVYVDVVSRFICGCVIPEGSQLIGLESKLKSFAIDMLGLVCVIFSFLFENPWIKRLFQLLFLFSLRLGLLFFDFHFLFDFLFVLEPIFLEDFLNDGIIFGWVKHYVRLYSSRDDYSSSLSSTGSFTLDSWGISVC